MKSTCEHLRSITVNGRFLSQPITGVQRYAIELLNALDILLQINSIEQVPVTVLAPQDAREIPRWGSLRVEKVGRLSGQLWEQLDLPIHARGSLLFTPCGGAPVVHRPHVITIHDAGPFSTPGTYTVAYRSYYKALQKILTRTAVHIITVSEFSRQELMGFLRIPPERITAIPLSGEHILRHRPDDAVLTRYALQPGRYILGVGSKNPNKNLSGLTQAAGYLPAGSPEIVIAGGSNHSVFANAQDSPAGIRELGFVDDSELRTLYESAGCFLFPSFYEGFGLPPLEALTLGCPVVVARAASLPEVFREIATYCDPRSPQDIAGQVSRVLAGGHPSRESLVAFASQFTWERCAKETWKILSEALNR